LAGVAAVEHGFIVSWYAASDHAGRFASIEQTSLTPGLDWPGNVYSLLHSDAVLYQLNFNALVKEGLSCNLKISQKGGVIVRNIGLCAAFPCLNRC
jgi:hypothetical protein